MGLSVEIFDADSSNFFLENSKYSRELVIYHYDRYICPSLVWSRVKIFPPIIIDDDNQRNTFFRNHEWISLYKDIEIIFRDILINSIESKYNISTRIYQLNLAKSVGFNIPDTYITNNKKHALGIFRSGNTMATKSLSSKPIINFNDDEIKYMPVVTNYISKNEINESSEESISQAPILIQDYIQKKYEYRIIAVNGRIFSFLTNSQEKDIAKIDWRLAISELKWSYCKLPADIEDMINVFMKQSGLFYGVFDLIENKQGDYYFLECNPNGQWFWLDPVVDGEISRGFAESIYDYLTA